MSAGPDVHGAVGLTPPQRPEDEDEVKYHDPQGEIPAFVYTLDERVFKPAKQTTA